MEIEVIGHQRMSESGSSLLRLIQNQNMPLLDLLVRESVQNSLDASNGSKSVNVDISVKSFNPKIVNKHLSGITHALNSRFPQARCDSIIISDSNTVGLNGPVQVTDNNFGNCVKLVYEISKPQTNEGAGGSWGLGKTIYYRIGIGLVFYYSRIREKGVFKSRLAACLVEDETKGTSLLPSVKNVKRGIAWWGKLVQGSTTTIPIDDESEISEILSSFDISPYTGMKTGTTIIIPYINKSRLLQEVYANSDIKGEQPYWTLSVEEYLKVALQKWYAPRILNKDFPGAFLYPTVNDKVLKISDFLPLFRLVRDMYIYAITNTIPYDSLITEERIECNRESIKANDVFTDGSTAGIFVYAKMTNVQLLMTYPDNQRSPYQQISNRSSYSDGVNTPIIMFTRKPGMIVGYDYDGPWTHRMPKSEDNEYVIGLFVLNSSNKLKGIYDDAGKQVSLEEYIRHGEKADHASWSDRNINGIEPRIVYKVQRTITRVISQMYKEAENETKEKKHVGLSHALADLLLPGTGFGHSASIDYPVKNLNANSLAKKASNPTFQIIGSPHYHNDTMILEYEAFIKRGMNTIVLEAITDYKKYSPSVWESAEEIGKPFPASIKSFSVNKIRDNLKNAWQSYDLIATGHHPISFESFESHLLQSEAFGTGASIDINSPKNLFIKGTIDISINDPTFKINLDIKKDKQ